jgi:hypothetical protein
MQNKAVISNSVGLYFSVFHINIQGGKKLRPQQFCDCHHRNLYCKKNFISYVIEKIDTSTIATTTTTSTTTSTTTLPISGRQI